MQGLSRTETGFWSAQRDAYLLVRAALDSRSWESRESLPPEAGLHRRLLDAAAGVERGEAGPADIAALAGAVLRREVARPNRSEAPSLRLPQGDGWPTATLLAQASLRFARVGKIVRVEPAEWRPLWLDSQESAVLASVDGLLPRRRRWRVPADPFFTAATGLPTYSSVGQRDAARAVSATGPGGAVVVGLPTGTGKTVVGLLPALRPNQPGTALVFVPTVSLARDQEAELAMAVKSGKLGRDLRHLEFAYVGATAEDVRVSIRDRIRDGSQGVVFTAPESIASLASAVESAARDGLLSAFVVDEAHAVADWGSDFRPAFQMLSGFRRGLLDVAPPDAQFPTILLTGTLTDDAWETTISFLGSSDGHETALRVVVEEALRPEPEYWLGECRGEEERLDRIVELAFHVPRPGIVYTNRPKQAQQIFEGLQLAGFKRIGQYTGQTPNDERLRVEATWRDTGSGPTRYDLVVATSAFGLGINQPDVRAVVHARVPESLNRYYQEVGRGGRDGRASLAILLNDSASDFRDAERIAGQQLLRDRLEPRWRTMFEERRAADVDRGISWCNIDAIPFDQRGRKSQPVKADRLWNMNALTLLQRAGLVRLHEPLHIERPEDGKWIGVELLNPRVLTPEWRQAWEDVRGQAYASRDAELSYLREVVSRARPMEHILQDALELRVFERSFRPNDTCGGCPVCRQAGFGPRVSSAPSRLAERGVAESTLARDLRQQFGGRLLLTHHATSETGAQVDFVHRAIDLGLRRLAIVGERALDIDRRLLETHSVFLESELPEGPWCSWSGGVEALVVGTTGVVLPEWCVSPPVDSVRVVIFPENLPDPDRSDRTLTDMRGSWPLESVVRAMRQWHS